MEQPQYLPCDEELIGGVWLHHKILIAVLWKFCYNKSYFEGFRRILNEKQHMVLRRDEGF